MNRYTYYIFPLLFLLMTGSAYPQKIDSIYFHLYTDSLKKGQHNYINVDGKFADGRWLPLTEKEIQFSCAEARFEGNELIIPEDFQPLKVKVRATLKANPSVSIERTVWIKQVPDPFLPTKEEMENAPSKKNKRRN